MSLTATWCKCSDGIWYEEPVWKGYDDDGKLRWFLVLDDYDDPELVICTEGYSPDWSGFERKAKMPILDWFKPHNTKIPKFTGGQWRQFGKKMKPAINLFGTLTKTPPPPQSHGKKSETRPDYMGSFYEFKE